MIQRAARLFTIKSKFEAFLVIYALALGGAQRGVAYLGEYPGHAGQMMFVACTGAVFMAGAHILDSIGKD